MLSTLLLFLGGLGGSELLLIMIVLLGAPVLLLLIGVWWFRSRKSTVVPTPVSVANELSKLQQLREQGVLKAQEFEEQKQRVLR